MKVVFEVVEDSASEFYEVIEDTITIGRDPDKCDIVLEEEGASKVHCMLEFKGGKWWVCDLDSKNGTFINNDPIKRHQLYLDDIVQIGEAYLRFASSHMSMTTNQLLRRPGKKYTFNKSITLIQGKNDQSEQFFDGTHHGMKEVTMVGKEGNVAKAKEMVNRANKKKKVKKKKKA